MCRLYGFRATEPTKVECTLVHAQNSLIAQSWEDRAGGSHADGWGIAFFENGAPHVERRAIPAYHGEHFERAAARTFSRLVIAHVRRATVGAASPENTHPFCDGRWVLAHNGTLRAFPSIRPALLEAMLPAQRAAVAGVTDSEHVFRFLLSLRAANPQETLLETLRRGLAQLVSWSRDVDPSARIGLNVLWTDGEALVGSRVGRTLWYVERRGILDCEVCGFPHVHHHPGTTYRALVVASEPITHESWKEVPDGSVFSIDAQATVHFEPLA
jgi:glutamine amidotransferase